MDNLGQAVRKQLVGDLPQDAFSLTLPNTADFLRVLRFPSRVTLDLKEWLKTTLPLELTLQIILWIRYRAQAQNILAVPPVVTPDR